MPYDPNRHNRRSIRLQGYDYSNPGGYFVTICVQNRECLFGAIDDGRVQLNDAGRMVERWWYKLPDKFPTVTVDEHIVMPNHFHGIIVISAARSSGGHADPPDDEPARVSLPRIVQWFKTMTTNAYIRGVKTAGWPRFAGRLWQRNYYERIIRNRREWHNIRRYIQNNPINWYDDRNHPNHYPS